MSDAPNLQPQASDSNVAAPRHPNLIARRRLLRGGLSAAPVLMISAPRSVMANTVACTTGSAFAFASLNASGIAATASQCSGRLPEHWSSCSLSYWPGTCLHNAQKTKVFNEVFGSANGYDQSVRLLDVLKFSNANPKDALAKYIVAALLNARKGLNPTELLSETTIREIWAKCSAGSYYEPTAAVRWYAGSSEPASSGGVVAWLQSTMS